MTAHGVNAATPGLISVLIRSINRPQLVDALRSVVAQTYRPLEIVVAAASAEAFALPDIGTSDVTLRLVGGGRALGLSAAANLALDEAHGEYLIFLDDDDYFLPTHIAGLFQALQSQPDMAAAYSGIRMETAAGEFIGLLQQPRRYSRRSLHLSNFIQISAALFSREVVNRAKARFDEALPLFVDWDFWLQLAAIGPFLYVPQFTTCWRTEGGVSGAGMGTNRNDEKRRFAGAYIRDKHAAERQRIENEVTVLMRQADAAWARGDLPQLRSICARAMALDAQQPALFNRLGLMALQAQQWQDAEAWLGEGLLLAPQEPTLLANLAQVYAATERSQHARVYAHLATLLQPGAEPIHALAQRLGATVDRR